MINFWKADLDLHIRNIDRHDLAGYKTKEPYKFPTDYLDEIKRKTLTQLKCIKTFTNLTLISDNLYQTIYISKYKKNFFENERY